MLGYLILQMGFTNKKKENGDIIKYKARLVAAFWFSIKEWRMSESFIFIIILWK